MSGIRIIACYMQPWECPHEIERPVMGRRYEHLSRPNRRRPQRGATVRIGRRIT